MNDITALMATMKAAAEKAIEANDRLCVMPPDEIFDVSLAHSKQLDADITLLNAHYDESTPANVLALVEALEARDKQIAEMQTKDINVKRKAQALFDAIQNPADVYIPAYVRCLRNALAGVAVEGE